jgi:hypothetical protein
LKQQQKQKFSNFKAETTEKNGSAKRRKDYERKQQQGECRLWNFAEIELTRPRSACDRRECRNLPPFHRSSNETRKPFG